MTSIRMSLKMSLLVVAATAVAIMFLVTIAANSSGPLRSSISIVADTSTETTPPSTPAVPSARPLLKSTPFKGGDWPGMGSFGEDWS